MQDTTFLFPQTVISNGTYTGNPIINPQYLLSSTGFFAQTASVTSLGSDVVLGNFLFNIPQNSIIEGIEVSFTGYRDVAASPATVLDIYAYDNTGGNNFFYQLLPQFAGFSTIPVTYYFGSSTYLFNTTWTADQINNLKIRLQANGALFLEGLQVRVTFSPPGGSSVTTNNVCGSIFQAQPFQLIQPVSTSALDVIYLVNRFQTSDGVPITNADIPTNGIPITIDQGNDQEENDYVTVISPTSGNQVLLTVTRGWSFRDPITQTAPLRRHSSGAEIVISNSVPFYDIFLRKCQIGSLVSAPISALDEGALITPYIRSLNFVGAGVFATGTPNVTGGKDITVTIPGFTTAPPIPTDNGSGTTGGVQVLTSTDPGVITHGVNRLLFVSVSLESTQTITGITFNGVGLTFRAARNQGSARVEVWTLTAPTLGMHPLIISTSGLTYLAWEWVNFNGTDPVTPWTIGSTNGANTNISTGAATTVTNNAIVMHAAATKLVGIAYTAGSGEALIATSLTGAVQGGIESQSVGTPATVTSNIAFSSVTDWANVLSSINGITPPLPVAGVQVKNSGVALPGTFTTLNLINPGISAIDAGGGQADVSTAGGGLDHFVAVDGADTTPDFLDPKLNIHSSDGSVTVTKTITNPAANEILDYDLTGAGSGATYKNGDTTKNAADASGVQNIPHGLGTTPKKVQIDMMSGPVGGSPVSKNFWIAKSVYNGITQSSQSFYTDGAGFGNYGVDNTFSINSDANSNGHTRGVITFDAVNIIITWTKTSFPTGIYQLLWQAEA